MKPILQNVKGELSKSTIKCLHKTPQSEPDTEPWSKIVDCLVQTVAGKLH